MKRLVVISILTLVILLVACSPKNQYVCPDSSVVDDPSKCGQMQEIKKENVSTTPAPTVKEESAPTPELQKELAELLSIADKKVNDFSYLYVEPPYDVARDWYFVRGNKTKIKLFETNWYKKEEYLDTIFLDSATKTAIGMCLDKREVRCPDKTKKVRLNYTEFVRKTPYQWLSDIKSGEIEGGEQINDRNTVKVKTVIEGKLTTVWIDEYFGLPIQIRIGKEDDEKAKLYQFRDISINGLKDQDVMPAN